MEKLFFFDDLTKWPHYDQMPLDEVIKVNKLVTVVTNREYKDLPNLEKYPLEEVVEKFGSRYFANSIAFMIAYALYHRYERIELYGIDHGGMQEYVMAKACVEYWIGRAQGMGVDVYIPDMCALMRLKDDKLYGYDGAVESAQEIFTGH